MREIRTSAGCLDGERNRVRSGLLIPVDLHHLRNDQVAGGVEVAHIGEPLPGKVAGGDFRIDANRLNCDPVIANADDAASNATADLDSPVA